MLATQKTYQLKEKDIRREWWLVDLEGKTLGRVATRIADILKGKHRPTYTPSIDGGDFVVAINASKIHLTGEKWKDKRYFSHSGFPGGLKSRSAGELRETKPEALITKAVKGMLPKNYLALKILKKLKVYPDKDHPHVAQNPKLLDLK